MFRSEEHNEYVPVGRESQVYKSEILNIQIQYFFASIILSYPHHI